MSRGWGTMHFDRGFDDNFIPSAPFNPDAMTQADPRHLTLEDESVARRRPVESRFNPETGELVIDLWFNSPETSKQEINLAIRNAKVRGLQKIVLVLAAETFADVAAYHFCTRNKFERRLSNEPAGYIRLEKSVRAA